jgi:hypothetical protein
LELKPEPTLESFGVVLKGGEAAGKEAPAAAAANGAGPSDAPAAAAEPEAGDSSEEPEFWAPDDGGEEEASEGAEGLQQPGELAQTWRRARPAAAGARGARAGRGVQVSPP